MLCDAEGNGVEMCTNPRCGLSSEHVAEPRAAPLRPTREGQASSVEATQAAMARASISLSSGGTAAASQDKECAAPSIRVGQASKVGTRHDDNEDWGLVCTDLFAQASDVLSGLEYAGVPNRKLSVFSVFDGHGQCAHLFEWQQNARTSGCCCA